MLRKITDLLLESNTRGDSFKIPYYLIFKSQRSQSPYLILEFVIISAIEEGKKCYKKMWCNCTHPATITKSVGLIISYTKLERKTNRRVRIVLNYYFQPNV